jgi:A/G-specific adenine glycosylase
MRETKQKSLARSEASLPEAAELAPLVAWYRARRRDLPWRRTRDPYAIWLSETMLQQTRVETVIPYYERFLAQMPTVQSLAEASEDQVLTLWSGLGYYRRARMLHAAARRMVREHGARLPEAPEQLRALEGVGRYTAGAVASIAFGKREALVDGNVARVIARLFAIRRDVKAGEGSARVWAIAERLVTEVSHPPGDWNQALMELGATVCTPRDPSCEACPVATACQARALGLERQLPVVTPKKAPVEMCRVALVLASDSSVVLARRRKQALFGGLWEPPAIDQPGEPGPALARLARQLGVDPRGLRAMGDVEHVLTHRRMRVVVARGPLGRRRRWPLPSDEYEAIEVVRLERLAGYARASLVNKVLGMAGLAMRLAKPTAHGHFRGLLERRKDEP